MTELSVVVGSVRRPDELTRCLSAVEAQMTSPLEAVVVAEVSDPATQGVATEHGARVCLASDGWGVAAAYEAGTASVSGDIAAICDDDAVPCSWSKKIVAILDARPRLGVVSARDYVGGAVTRTTPRRVGRVGPVAARMASRNGTRPALAWSEGGRHGCATQRVHRS